MFKKYEYIKQMFAKKYVHTLVIVEEVKEEEEVVLVHEEEG